MNRVCGGLGERRRFLKTCAGSVVFIAGTPLGASAQAATKKRVVRATIPYDDPQASLKIRQAWLKMFAAQGFPEETIEIEVVKPRKLQLEANAEYDAIVRRVLESRPDVIIVHGVWLASFARFTREVPIVFSGMIDPESFVETARRPGGNVTGSLYPMWELQAKRIALAKDMMPRARRVAVVANGMLDRVGEKIKSIAAALGMEGVVVFSPNANERDLVTNALREARVDIADIVAPMHLDCAADMLKMGILGTGAGMDDRGIDGILLTYDAMGLEEVAAELAARILKGEKVSTLPAREPLHFRMTINLRTARALGITVPAGILVRANAVFE